MLLASDGRATLGDFGASLWLSDDGTALESTPRTTESAAAARQSWDTNKKKQLPPPKKSQCSEKSARQFEMAGTPYFMSPEARMHYSWFLFCLDCFLIHPLIHQSINQSGGGRPGR